jgi:hypothetical protein
MRIAGGTVSSFDSYKDTQQALASWDGLSNVELHLGEPGRLSCSSGAEAIRVEESFAERWACKERERSLESFPAKMVTCGLNLLPESAAPFFTFDQAARPVPIWEVFGVSADWSPALRERLTRYRMIGADGAGNLICLEQVTGQVVLLDHEDRFRTGQFVNSGIDQLTECLLVFMAEQDPDRLRKPIAQIDPAALAERSFWWHEAHCLGS